VNESSGRDPAIPAVTPDLPSLPWRATLRLLQRLPQASLSRTLGSLADLTVPRRLRGPIIGGFARAVGINVGEAELPIEDYRSINEFFVRRLRTGVRSWPDDDSTIASPVDGVVGRHGSIRDGRLIQAKGRHYMATDLLAGLDEADRYEDGTFVTLYLSPRHYHRIHAPCGGVIHGAHHVPGALLPVNDPAVRHVPDLFPRNERVICTIAGPLGTTAVVAVGAYNVGRISTTFDPEWVGAGRSVANRRRAEPESRRYAPPKVVRQGEEIMAFHLGSTVVLLVEPGAQCHAPPPGTEVQLGDVLLRGA
jgi:phosphatidylserine decarboxylase